MAFNTYKIVITGPPCGKTPWVHYLAKEPTNIPGTPQCILDLESRTQGHTLGVEIHPLVVRTNRGTLSLNIWDCGGMHRGLGEGYYTKANVAIIFGNDQEEHEYYAKGIPEECHQIRVVLPVDNMEMEDIIEGLRHVRRDPHIRLV